MDLFDLLPEVELFPRGRDAAAAFYAGRSNR
jgi:hypothetical protein